MIPQPPTRHLIAIGSRRAGQWVFRRASELRKFARPDGSCPCCKHGTLYAATYSASCDAVPTTRRMCDKCLYTESE